MYFSNEKKLCIKAIRTHGVKNWIKLDNSRASDIKDMSFPH